MIEGGEAATTDDGIAEPDIGDMNIDFGEEAEVDGEEAANNEGGESGSEAAVAGEQGADGEEDLSDVTFDENQQKVFDREIGKKVGKTRETERENQKLQEEIAALKAKVPQAERPEVLEIPDKDDPDYETKIEDYNKSVLAANEFDQNELALSEKTREQEETAQKEIIDGFNDTITTYAERSGKLGIKPEDLEKSGAIVAEQGLHDAVVVHILEEPVGPQINMYMAKNPQVAEKLNEMSPMQAAAHIESVVKPAAMKAGKKVDNTPEPIETLKGSGSPEGDLGPPGVIYE